MKLVLISVIITLISINHINSFTLKAPKETQYRLKNDVTPINYDIELTTDLDKEEFTGKVQIKLNVLKKTKTIRFHTLDLKLNEIKLVSKDGEIPFEKEMPYDDKSHIKTITTVKELKTKEEYVLSMSFSGKLGEPPGYYLLKYKSGNKDYKLAVTHFEPTLARKAFPCFDEPELRATFNVKLTHDSKYTAYSNSNAKESKKSLKDDKTVTTEFETTPIMSTYLVAFALLPDDFEQVTVKNDPRTIVLMRNAVKSNADFISSKASAYLKELEEITGVSYDKTLGELKHLAIPNGITGGMENWGLIVYGEAGLTYDESSDFISQKYSNQRVLAHEIVHQWFGDLVSTKWWTHLWLKEGFASYFEYIVEDRVDSGEYGTLKECFAHVHHKFLKLDSSKNSRPMDKEVETPEDIQKNFDVVHYEKGGQLLYMLEHIIGTKNFMAGIQKYVKDNQYKSVTPDNLWKALQDNADSILDDKTVAEIGNSWSQAGYPVVHVSIKENKLIFTQKRFLTDSTEADKTLWLVPINFITSLSKTKDVEKTAPTHWLEKETLEVPLDKSIDFVIANNEHTGYYRVNYDAKNWKAIGEHLNTPSGWLLPKKLKLNTVTQAQLLDDAFTFANNGDLKFEVAIELTRFLEKSDDYLPWTAVSGYLADIYNKISMTATLSSYETYLSQLVRAAFNKVLLNDKHEKKTNGLLQEMILPIVVLAKCPEFIAESEEKMTDIKKSSTTVPKYLQRYVFCGAANKEFDYLLKQLGDKKSEFNKNDLLFGLSCVSDIKNIEKVLEVAEDKFTYVRYLTDLNPIIVYENTDKFQSDLTDEEQKAIMKSLAVRIGTKEQLDAIKEVNEGGKLDEFYKLAEANYNWNVENKALHKWIVDEVQSLKPSSTTEEDPNATTEDDPNTTTEEDPNATTEEDPSGTTGDPGGALSATINFSILSLIAVVVFLM